MKKYYCPVCFNKLEIKASWGGNSYYCKVCKWKVPKEKILSDEKMKAQKAQKEAEQ